MIIDPLIKDGRSTTILRRCITIPTYCVAAVMVWLALPLWIAVAFAVDLVRDSGKKPRFILVRLLLFAAGYLACEVVGIAIAFLLWLTALVVRPSRNRFRRWNFWLQCQWGASLLRIGQTTFDFRFETTGEDCVAPGPIFLLLRHSSLADTVLAVSQISKPHGIILRYVLKRPLLMDPCLDIVGQRLINLFVYKRSGSRVQIEGVANLARDLSPDEGVLIYPEGTRFTVEKQQAHFAKLDQRGLDEEAEFARTLQHILPPIRGGIMALLEVNDQLQSPADVVFCAHAGFEGSATLKDLMAGRLLHRTVRIHFWRVAAEEIPKEREDRDDWLKAEWWKMDQTIGSLLGQRQP